MTLGRAGMAIVVATLPLFQRPAEARIRKDATFADRSQLVFTYPGNHGFIHEIGVHVPSGWSARYRIDPPGYFIRGRITGGDELASGTFEFRFHFAIQAGSLGGLFNGANDIVRIEAWDRTTQERLLCRTFQEADFPRTGRRDVPKSLVFSTIGREGHRFEPRVYWSGLSSLYLNRVELRRLERVTAESLEAKAALFEQTVKDLHEQRGFVLTRKTDGTFADMGDAAVWTGLYAASQAWRYRATHDPRARVSMERSLKALHRLHAWSPTPGTLVRYISPRGEVLVDPASKDTYTGFFFALAQCLPLVRDRTLRRELLQDTETIASHFLDHDLSFSPAGSEPLSFNPYPAESDLTRALADLSQHERSRLDLARILQAVQWYFRIHRQSPWPELAPFLRALRDNDREAIRRKLFPALTGARRALGQVQRNVQRSDLAYRVFLPKDPIEAIDNPEAPYGKLNRVLRRAIDNLNDSLGERPLQSVTDARILPAQALHALHFIKVAAEVLPKPNRFDTYYRENLTRNKQLLLTLQEWNNLDEEALAAVFGHTRAAVMRNATRHLGYLALFDLIQLEKDPTTLATFRNLFEQEYAQMQEDYNAMLHVMRHVLAMGPDQTGIGLWSLQLYPLNRRGLGEDYWRSRNDAFSNRFGELNGQARDPVPLDLRQRDTFIWQRSARSIRGDDSQRIYPPLDYLFVYWLARANRVI